MIRSHAWGSARGSGLGCVMFSIVTYLVRRAFLPLLILGAGWYGGAKFGAPDLLIRAVDGVAARAAIALEPILNRGVEEGGEIVADVVEEGSDYVVGTVEDFLEELATVPDGSADADGATDSDNADTVVADAGDAAASGDEPSGLGAQTDEGGVAAATSDAVAEKNIVLCRTNISNAPRAEANGIVQPANATVRIDGVTLLLMPATKSCLSSGYGPRGGKIHKGIDYYTKEDGNVLAASNGVIRERVTRADYGNMVVIDHGNGVFTRYAHLARFGSGVTEGATVNMGQVLAPIGNSGSSTVVHLHYEILTGEWIEGPGSFGLDAVDPFTLPSGSDYTGP